MLRHLVKALLLIVQETLYSTATGSHYHEAFVYFDPANSVARLALGAPPHHPVAIWSPPSASGPGEEWVLSTHAVRAFSLIHDDRPDRRWSYSSHGTSSNWSCNLCHKIFQPQDAPAHVATHTHQNHAAALATQLVKELNQRKLRLTVPQETTP